MDPLAPSFYYSIKRKSESCIEAFVFRSEFVIAKFTTGVLVFRLRNQFESAFYPASQSIFSSIAVSDDFMFIFADQSIKLLSSPSVFFTFDFSSISLAKVFVSSQGHILAIDANNLLS